MSRSTFGSFFNGHFNPTGIGFEEEIGFLIIMDLLGVKKIWESMQVSDFFNSWRMVNHLIDDSLDAMRLPYQKNIFSDTIIITVKSNNNNNNNNLIQNIQTVGKTLGNIIRRGVENDFFFRGAINHGKYWKSASSIIGPAIDDASICYEKPQLIGIIASKDFETTLNSSTERSCLPFFKYNIPLKVGTHSGWVLHWNNDSNTSHLERIKNNENDPSKDEHVRKKYENTRNAINFYGKYIK